jgi:GNAT superfamily N-acetyltransferase
MMTEFVITSGGDADELDGQSVLAGLRVYNEAHAGPAEQTKVQLFLRDGTGAVRGGLIGRTLWNWLYIETLWIAEPARGAGLGSRLLVRAEDDAKRGGCTRVLLDTFEFQALGFYERHGYQVFGVLEDFPPGFRRYYLRKDLVGSRPGQ